MSETDKPDELEILRQRLDATNDALDRLEVENGDLRERVAELEDLIGSDLAALEYEQYTKRDKVRLIHDSLAESAESTLNGKAAMNYRDVMWLFDGQPSPGHAYDLMELAGKAQGYNYEENDGQDNRVTVNVDAVNAEAPVHGANKAPQEPAP